MADTYVALYDDQGGRACIVEEDEPRVDAGVSAFMDSGGTRDSLLYLTMVNGQRYVLRASAVQSWVVCTPAGRLRTLEIEQREAEEDRANRLSLGLAWDAE